MTEKNRCYGETKKMNEPYIKTSTDTNKASFTSNTLDEYIKQYKDVSTISNKPHEINPVEIKSSNISDVKTNK